MIEAEEALPGRIAAQNTRVGESQLWQMKGAEESNSLCGIRMSAGGHPIIQFFTDGREYDAEFLAG
jgi:hypothetical protein